MISRRANAVSWTLGIAFLLVYLACPNTHNSFDSVGWARYLDEYGSAPGSALSPGVPKKVNALKSQLAHEKVKGMGVLESRPGWWVLWNPHHLLYLPITATLFRLLKQLLPMLGGITFLQWWNALAAAATLMFILRLLIRIVPENPYALPWCIFLGTSVTFFAYATDGAQYPTAVFFLALASNSLWSFWQNPETKNLAKSGFWLAIAVLFHQLASLIVPFLFIAVLLRIRDIRKSGEKLSYRPAWLLPILGLGIPALVYLLIGFLALGPSREFTPSGILKYATLYARQSSYWSQSFWAGLLTNLQTFPGFYFGTRRLSELILSNVWFTGFVLILPAMWLASILTIRRLAPDPRSWLHLCLLWILPLLIFLSMWVPGQDFYHLFLAIPLSCLAAIRAENPGLSARRQKIEIAVFWIWCILGAIINLPQALSGSIWFSR